MTLEYGDQSYFPSSKCRFSIRFEEYGTSALKGKAPKKSTTQLKGVKDERAPLTVVSDPEAANRFLLVPATGGPNTATSTPGAGPDQQKSSDDLTHEISGIIPKTASWTQQGIRTGATLSLQIRWIDMPVDPRVIRACAVSFFLGSVTSQEFAMGIAGTTRGGLFGGGVANAKESLNLIPDTYLDKNGNQRTNLRFQGWVDKYKMTLSNEGEPHLELECADNTRLFIKQTRPPKLFVGKEKPIDEAVAEYLTHFPQLEGLVVEYRPIDTDTADKPKLGPAYGTASIVPNLGPPPSGGGGAAAGGEQQNIWEYLNVCCNALGHTIRIDGRLLIIQKLSNLMGAGPGSRADDPYRGRHLASGDYPARTLIYGRNLLELSVERDYTRKQPQNVEMRAYDASRKNVLVVRYPEKGDEIVNSGPGDGKADKNWNVQYAPAGVTDKVTLKEIAKEYYNNQGRQELTIHAKTKNLASFGGDNEDPDLLDMKVGDPFEVLVNRSTDDSTLNEVEKKLAAVDLNKQLMIDLGYSAEFAAAYAQAFTDAGFQREYKMKEMKVDWSSDEGGGVSFDITGTNYVVARVDQPNPAATAPPAV